MAVHSLGLERRHFVGHNVYLSTVQRDLAISIAEEAKQLKFFFGYS
jgi:hypothetical protein